MTRIRTINSEVEMKKTSNRNLKYNLTLDQKDFYFDEGATYFYNTNTLGGPESEQEFLDKNYNFFEKNFLEKDKTTTFISLGCGNSQREKLLIEKAESKGYEINYYGVDSSMKMIELSQENFSKKKHKSRIHLCRHLR